MKPSIAFCVAAGALMLASAGWAQDGEARARKIIGGPLDDPVPDATGWYGRGRPGPAVRFALGVPTSSWTVTPSWLARKKGSPFRRRGQ